MSAAIFPAGTSKTSASPDPGGGITWSPKYCWQASTARRSPPWASCSRWCPRAYSDCTRWPAPFSAFYSIPSGGGCPAGLLVWWRCRWRQWPAARSWASPWPCCPAAAWSPSWSLWSVRGFTGPPWSSTCSAAWPACSVSLCRMPGRWPWFWAALSGGPPFTQS